MASLQLSHYHIQLVSLSTMNPPPPLPLPPSPPSRTTRTCYHPTPFAAAAKPPFIFFFSHTSSSHSSHIITSQKKILPLHIIKKGGEIATKKMMASSSDDSNKKNKNWVQLNSESDFQSLLSHTPDRSISICGFGSLLSERSARSTFPDLVNFRIAKLNGFRRVFAHAAPIFFDRGIANPQTREIASLSVEPCDGETLIVTVFEIKESEIPSFIEREHEFRFLAVTPETLDGVPFTSPAVLCGRYSDEEYLEVRLKGSKELYFERYGRYNIDKIWRDDILPCRVYLRHCVLAAKNLDDAAYNNFLDHTFLGDRKTTIREYLATEGGSGIMEEEPPELLKFRYGG